MYCLLTNVIEEVDLLLLCEERSTNTVYRSISPSLKETVIDTLVIRIKRGAVYCSHLIVETALLIEEVEELAVCFASP